MAEFVNLFEWIHTVESGDFPPAPYEIAQGRTIICWDKHLESLCRESPTGPMSRTGALQENLRRLYILWNSGPFK